MNKKPSRHVVGLINENKDKDKLKRKNYDVKLLRAYFARRLAIDRCASTYNNR